MKHLSLDLIILLPTTDIAANPPLYAIVAWRGDMTRALISLSKLHRPIAAVVPAAIPLFNEPAHSTAPVVKSAASHS